MKKDFRSFLLFVSVSPWFVFCLLFASPAFSLEADRSEAYYHYLLGSFKERARQYSAAIQEYREALRYDPKASEIYSRLAELYIQTNRTQEAIQDARKAIEGNPDNKEAHRMLGQIYLERIYQSSGNAEDLQLAIQEFQEVLRIDPKDGSAALSLGQLYLQNNQAQAAADLLKEYLENDPNSPAALISAASAYQQLNQIDTAIEYLLRYLELNPGNISSIQQVADLYEKAGDYAKALGFLKRAYDAEPDNLALLRKYIDLLEKNQKFPEAIRILEERVARDPQRPQWKVLLARTLQKSGAPEKAEDILKAEISRNPEDLDLRFALIQILEENEKYRDALHQLDEMEAKARSDSSMAEREKRGTLALIFSHKGYSAQRLKEYDRAIESYKKALDFVDPEDRGRIEFYIALSYEGQKKWDEAIKILNGILQRDANDADSWELLSAVYEAKGDRENSDKVIQHLIDTHPNSPRFYILKAERLQERQNYAESIEILKVLPQKFPANDQIYFLLGAASERLKKIEDAEEYFKKTISINPRNANALNYLGYMLIDSNIRVEESIGYVKEALEIDRDNGAYLDSLGWGYFKLNQLDLAEDYLRRALERLEDNAVVHDHMGDLFFKRGKFEQAIEHWETALKGDGTEVDPEYIRKKIADTKSRLP